MNAIVFWKLLSELSLYFALAHFIATPAGAEGALLGNSLMLALAGTLGRAIDRAGHPRWRWAALALLIPAFLWTQSWIEAALLLLPAAYVCAMLARHLGDGTYYEYHDQYEFGLPLMGGAGLLLLIFWSADGLSAHVLPHMLAYLVSGVLALRLLRHSDDMLKSRRLRIYNLVSVLAICGAGWLITSEAAMNGLKAVLGFLFRTLVAPVIALLGYVMGAIMTGLWMLISQIGYQGDSELLNGLMQQADDEVARALEQGEINEVPANVLMGIIVLAAFVLLAVMLFRFLKKPRAQRENAIHEVRSTIDGAVRDPRSTLFDRSARARIRATYRKFLALLTDSGASLHPADTTADIDRIAQSALCSPPEVEHLREVYCRARYGAAEPDDADAEAAKRAWRAIRDHVKKMK